MKTSEVLNQAADDIERWGWRAGEGWFAEPGQPSCAEGSITRVCKMISPVNVVATRRPAFEAFRAHVGGMGWVWNDEPGRTASDVVEALRAAAVIEAAREEQDAAYATYELNVAVSA